MGAGTQIGNILGLILVCIAALLGFISFKVSIITFLIISYGAWFILQVFNLVAKPSEMQARLAVFLSPHEVETYRIFHLFLHLPGAASTFSSMLNMFRVSGFIWGGLAIWFGYYWLGGASIALFFVVSGLIVRLNPALYVATGAARGNELAMEQLAILQDIQARTASAKHPSET